jgi:hypothetical protein
MNSEKVNRLPEAEMLFEEEYADEVIDKSN